MKIILNNSWLKQSKNIVPEFFTEVWMKKQCQVQADMLESACL